MEIVTTTSMDGNRDGLACVPQYHVDAGRSQEQQEHRLRQHVLRNDEEIARARSRELIGAIACEPACRFCGCQSLMRQVGGHGHRPIVIEPFAARSYALPVALLVDSRNALASIR